MKAILFIILYWGSYCSVYSQLPTANFSASENYVCPSTCVNFINQSINATSYQWIFQGGTPATSTNMNPSSVCYLTPGNFDVTLIATNSLGSDTLIIQNCISVYPYSPSLGMYQVGDSLIVNSGFVSYQWYLNGSLIPGATDSVYLGSISGNYYASGIDSNGCEVSTIIFWVWLDVKESETKLFISPNPVNEELIIGGIKLAEATEVKIYNALGLVVKSEIICCQFQININLSDLPPGMYFVDIKNLSRYHREKVIKR
jgi:PKD repeat protein